MSVTKVQETAEAVCGALHRLHWELMGETDGGASTWFIRGEKPKQVQIEVQRSKLADFVLVNVEWPNVSLWPRVIRGRITFTLDVNLPREQLEDHTEATVRRCLEIFRDVISGEGIAGPVEAAKAPPE